MEITENLLQKIISTYNPENENQQSLAHHVADSIRFLNGINQGIKKINKEILDAKRRYDTEIYNLEQKKAKLSDECGHPDMETQSDPCGSWDKSVTCLICGKEL